MQEVEVLGLIASSAAMLPGDLIILPSHESMAGMATGICGGVLRDVPCYQPAGRVCPGALCKCLAVCLPA